MTKTKPNKIIKLSRTKWDNFIQCPFCFYLKEKHDINPPNQPGHPINSRVDTLLKEDFDELREKKAPHAIFKKYNLNFVPYNLDKMDEYRNKGIFAKSTKTNFTIYGKLDDLWLNLDSNEIVILDYKATSSIRDPDFVNSSRHYYKKNLRQLDFYAYLLKLNNYKVFKTGYWFICNAKNDEQEKFEGKLLFKTSLLPYNHSTDYIEGILVQIEKCLEMNETPSPGKDCDACRWRNDTNKF